MPYHLAKSPRYNGVYDTTLSGKMQVFFKFNVIIHATRFRKGIEMSNIALLVYDVTLTGGAERVALNLAGEFARKKADPDKMSDKTDKNGSTEHKKNNVYIISVAMSGVPDDLYDGNSDRYSEDVEFLSIAPEMGSITLNFLRYKRRLKRILKEKNIDILMSITAGVVTLAIAAARGTKAKVIYCEHSNLENRTYGKKHVFRQHFGADHADAVVTLTKRDRGNFIRFFKTPKEKLFAIPNWYTPYDKQVSYDSTSKKIISVGRLEKVKGYEYTIECAERILKDNPDWEWDIYGDGTLREELQSMIDDRHIERLTLKGNASDIRDRYPGYAFLVLTSLYEGFSLALLEAQVAGLPIVSFDCPTGPSEIVSNGVNGYVVTQFDVDELTDKVQELISSPDMRVSFSEHAGDMLHRYEKKRVIRQWQRVFNRLSNSD